MASTVDTASNPNGKRLLPHIIDDIARREPQREAFQVPNSSEPKDGWRTITFKDYANAINHIAHRIIKVSGEPKKGTFPTIAYIGPQDARYVVLFIAAIKAGYQALYISPRNSQEGQINLFDKTDCHIMCFAKSYRNVVQPWLQERDMRAVEVGEPESWFPQEEVPHFPYNKTYEEAEWDPVMVLHTSGSTGFPKPIVCRVGMVSTGDAWKDLPDLEGHPFVLKEWANRSKRQWIPMPLFHAAALGCFINMVIFWKSPVALGVEKPLSTDSVLECLQYLDVEAVMLPPAILEDMSQEEASINALKKQKAVIFGGGNLGRDAGDRLAKSGVQLVNIIAATEFLPWPYHFQTNVELWRYFVINSEEMGVEWRPTDDAGVFEQIVVRKGKHPGMQGCFFTFPELSEYPTKDLYRPHPKLPHHWIYHGRADNIIVFSNGEKLNPVDIEKIVEDHPGVKGAVVVGTNKFQPAVIIEPVSHPKSEQEEKEFLDSVWPYVVRANKETVAHGQIGREFLTLTHPSKPFPRAGKGTIQRAGAINIYNDEIDQLYEGLGQVSSGEAPKLDVSSEDALVESLEKLFETRLGSPHLEPDTDFFAAGIDSMQIINASRLLRAGLEAAGHHTDATTLATRVVYGNPTPRLLARYLMETLVKGESKDEETHDLDQQRAMAQLYDQYTRDLVTAKKGRPEAAEKDQVVVVTGTTGMLGSYLLDILAHSPRVRKVICLNRADDGGVKQQAKAAKDRGLDPTYGGKAEFHHIDVSRSDLGLPKEVYEQLLREADRFIHNAWPVNFNITVETFAPQLRGVRNIADLAARAAKRVAVVFISSVGTADRWGATHDEPVPERQLKDWSLPSLGYGRSKMVASLILDAAAVPGDFPAAVIRVGQIAGPKAEAGAWNRHEWFPSIVASSLHLGALPTDLGTFTEVNWTPVEDIAGLVLEVAGATQHVEPAELSGYYHGVNPQETTWDKLAPAVQAFYGRDRLPELVSFREWVTRLEATQSEDLKSLDTNPGVKLLDSYRGMADAGDAGVKGLAFQMEHTVARSPSMRDATVITPELIQHWCKQWGF